VQFHNSHICWNLIKDPLTPFISPGFYSRTGRRGLLTLSLTDMCGPLVSTTWGLNGIQGIEQNYNGSEEIICPAHFCHLKLHCTSQNPESQVLYFRAVDELRNYLSMYMYITI
jgi:hypothetical protein